MSERTQKEYLTREELAERTGFSPATIQRLKRRGLIHFHQPGGKGTRIVFPANALERQDGESDAADRSPDDAASRRLSGPSPRWRQARSHHTRKS